MCLKTSKTLPTDAPAQMIAKLRSMFPAGNFPIRKGWLFQEKVPLQLLHLEVNDNIVPVWLTLSSGSGAKHK